VHIPVTMTSRMKSSSAQASVIAFSSEAARVYVHSCQVISGLEIQAKADSGCFSGVT
jgi:hypothetical protein